MRYALGAIVAAGIFGAAAGCCNNGSALGGAGGSSGSASGAGSGAAASSGSATSANSSSGSSQASATSTSQAGSTSTSQAATSSGGTATPSTGGSGTTLNSTTTGPSSSSSGTTGGSGTVGPPPPTNVLLVDNDGYVNDGSSPSDDVGLTFYQGLMTGHHFASYDTVAIDSSGDQSWNVSNSVVALPTAAQLMQYDTVIWFTSDNELSAAGSDWPLSTDQEQILADWLDLGSKKLVILSPSLVGLEQGGLGSWTATFTDPLFTTDLPLAGGLTDSYDCETASTCVPLVVPYGVSGDSAVDTAFASTEYYVQGPSKAGLLVHNGVTTALFNPASGADTVAFTSASPQASGLANAYLAVAVGAHRIGAMSSSNIVLVGFPPEAIQAGSPGSGLDGVQTFFDGMLIYAGIP